MSVNQPTDKGSKASPRTRRRRWPKRVLIGTSALVLFAALLVGAGIGYIAYRNHQIHHVRVVGLQRPAVSGPQVGVQTFLLIGSTSRCVLNNQQTAAFGSCAAGVTGVNSDVIMLLRADQQTHTVSILSIPRDFVLQNVRPGEFHKVDAALADGPSQLVAVIEQDFGIPINHFVELNFDSFQGIVNALGGVHMYFPDRVFDAESALNITTPGCHLLNGFQALAVVRARHMSYWVHGVEYYDGSGDLGRIIRDHEFLRVLASEVSHRGLGNLATDNAIIGSLAPQLTVDSGLSVTDMINLVLAFHSVNPNTAPQTTLPNIEDHTDYIYEGYDYGSVVLPSYPQDQQAVDSFLGLSSPPGSHIAPHSVTVSVLDGMSDPATASTTSAKLAALGFKVRGIGSTTAVGPLAETIVYYSRGHLLDAERVMQSLSGIVSMARGSTSDGADVTVVTGSNFAVRAPQHRKPGTPTSSPPPTTQPGAATPPGGSGPPGAVLEAPSPPTQQLPSYDPRACPGNP